MAKRKTHRTTRRHTTTRHTKRHTTRHPSIKTKLAHVITTLQHIKKSA